MIDIMLYVLLGIFIACVVQSLVDNYRTRRQAKDQVLTAKIRRISRQEMKSELDGRDLVTTHILKAELCAYIDSKLAEKEGEHESD